MNGIAEKLAKQIKAGKDVIIYGAGMEGENLVFSLKENFSAEPVCFCDGDQAKWHQKLLHIEILSIDEAIESYPEAFIYISSSLHKHQIIGYLTEQKGINPQQIINYERVEKRKSCALLETQMLAADHKLQFCCSDFGKNKSPALEFDGDYKSSLKKFFNLRDNLIDRFSHSLPTSCDGCPCVEETYYACDRKVRRINYSEGGICNSNCIYCIIHQKKENMQDDIQLAPILNILKDSGKIDEELFTFIACGEITIHPLRNEIYKAIQDYQNCVCTNSFKYDEGLQHLLEQKNSILNVSVDSGTKSTFNRVKGSDLFDTVKQNLTQYSQSGLIELKYIFLPEVNDNKKNVDGFIELCKTVGAHSAAISYDLFAPQIPTENMKNMILYMKEQITAEGLVCKSVSDVVNKVIRERGGK